MTILPELRDGLARTPPILPELRDGLVTARRRRRRRPVLVAGLAGGTLLATAGALAATGVIGIGAPVEPKFINRDPQRGVGVPDDRSARLLPLRVDDPDGGPPWGLRLAPTSRGMLCLQIGRVVDGRLGVLGTDGRLHPLPAKAAAVGLGCVPPDGAGRFFTAIDRAASVTGALRQVSCFEPGERERGRPACPPDESRQVAYGLLGPQAESITFADGRRQTVTGPEGAYLFVRARGKGDAMVAAGGGPSLWGPFAAVKRVDYRDGTSCPAAGSGSDEAFCRPKGYVEPRGPTKTSVRRRLKVSSGRGRYGPEVYVSFRAPAAITRASDVYLLEGRVPDSPIKQCRHVVMYVPTDRNIKRGDRVRLTGMVPKRCKGRLVAKVLLADISYSNGKGPAATVGRFTRTIR